jgi:hypothetical protein
LFHGHVVPNEAGRDVVIVFQAKEYPTGTVNDFRMDQYTKQGLLTPGMAKFSLGDTVMNQRNFIWTLKTNRVFLLNGAIRRTDPNSDFYKLMIDINNGSIPLTGDDVRAGTVQEKVFGRELFSVNYFPNQLSGGDAEQVFFTPVGSWGALKKLQTMFPMVAADQVEALFKSKDDSFKG